MKTLSYVFGKNEEIRVGQEYYFGQLWDGQDGDADELLDSGTVSPDNDNVVVFDIVEKSGDPLKTLVKITDIY